MRKQIDFNHELIGTEGITVERRDGVGIDFVKVYDQYVTYITAFGTTYTLPLNGVYNYYLDSPNTLLMFREIKEMSGDVWAYIRLTMCGDEHIITVSDLEAAFNAGKENIKELHGIK
jgi:hypothetical protein